MYQTIEELYNSITHESVDRFLQTFNKRLRPNSPLRVELEDLCSDEKLDLAWDLIYQYPRIVERMVSKP